MMNVDGTSETEITDPAIGDEEVCTYLGGTDFKKTCTSAGKSIT